MDVDNIAPGVDFVDHIQRTVASSGVLLALIGNDWLEGGPEGMRRVDDPTDFVRLEISAALQQGIPIIPILVERARMPRSDQLPDDLKPLVRRNALEIENARWDYDVSRLEIALDRLLVVAPAVRVAGGSEATPTTGTTAAEPPIAEPSPPTPPTPKRAWWRRKGPLVGVGAGLAVVVLLAVLLVPGLFDDEPAATLEPVPLFLALLTEEYAPAEIPERLSAPSSRLDPFETKGLAGAIRVSYPGPDDRGDLLFFDVFHTEADAKAWFLDDDEPPASFRTTGSFNPAGFDGPVRCITLSDGATPDESTQARSICRLYRGAVGVFALTARTTTADEADNDLAAAMARAAVVRLQRLERRASPATTSTLPARQLYGNIIAQGSLPELTPHGMSDAKLETFAYTAEGIVRRGQDRRVRPRREGLRPLLRVRHRGRGQGLLRPRPGSGGVHQER